MITLPFKIDWARSYPAARKKVGYLATVPIRDDPARRKIIRLALALLIIPAYLLGVIALLQFFWTPYPARVQMSPQPRVTRLRQRQPTTRAAESMMQPPLGLVSISDNGHGTE